MTTQRGVEIRIMGTPERELMLEFHFPRVQPVPSILSDPVVRIIVTEDEGDILSHCYMTELDELRTKRMGADYNGSD